MKPQSLILVVRLLLNCFRNWVSYVWAGYLPVQQRCIPIMPPFKKRVLLGGYIFQAPTITVLGRRSSGKPIDFFIAAPRQVFLVDVFSSCKSQRHSFVVGFWRYVLSCLSDEWARFTWFSGGRLLRRKCCPWCCHSRRAGICWLNNRDDHKRMCSTCDVGPHTSQCVWKPKYLKWSWKRLVNMAGLLARIVVCRL